ncbi:hypothetical protein BJ322DRAFT_1060995 [Thelephora terrestris]|uniref:Uncharacterized protein n=1 Tax=Thelephora terrestris TaxID=56493 RepID=A0A9P6L704_9AGAM|nr:hypothetical protein BJ322DRAFT_1060995 [Thelephora terrestris]
MVKKVLRDHEESPRQVLLKMDWDETALERLRGFCMEASPLEAYAMILELLRARRNSIPGELTEVLRGMARSAVRNSLRDPPLPEAWTPETNVRYEDYIRFTSYHQQCRHSLLLFLTTGALIKETGADWVWYNTGCGVCPTGKSFYVPDAAGKHPAAWWIKYWEVVVASIVECPCGETFMTDRAWAPTLSALAKVCPACYERARREYPRFSQKVLEKINNIIDNVWLEIER